MNGWFYKASKQKQVDGTFLNFEFRQWIGSYS